MLEIVPISHDQECLDHQTGQKVEQHPGKIKIIMLGGLENHAKEPPGQLDRV